MLIEIPMGIMLIGALIVGLLFPGEFARSPLQEKMFNEEVVTETIEADELRRLLPSYATVGPGTYTLVSLSEMPTGPQCHPEYPRGNLGGDCQDWSRGAMAQMRGKAFGIASDEKHMVNMFVTKDKKVRLYDASDCTWSGIVPITATFMGGY